MKNLGSPLRIKRSDIGAIFDNPFTYEDPRLPDLFWRELEDKHVVTFKIDLPEQNLPALAHFSGRTPGHQKLCAQVAAWLCLMGREYTALNKDLGYPGGVADVASVDLALFAECGYTRVGKILHGLQAGFEMVVASYSFDPVLFWRVSTMHFDDYLRKLEEGARRAVELLPIALRYEDVEKGAK
jgi:hypothetical protein